MIVLLVIGIAAFILAVIGLAIWDGDKKFRDEDLGKVKINVQGEIKPKDENRRK